MDDLSQAKHAAALAVGTCTWLRDEEAATTDRCSRRVQQPYRSTTTRADRDLAADLRQRPSTAHLPLDGKEKVRQLVSGDVSRCTTRA
jgi:hypothetical protein